MPKTAARRDEAKYQVLPPLDAETYFALKANVALRGITVPVVRDEEGYLLDGFARARIARELDYDLPSVTVRGLSEQEKRSQVRALNLARRQLDQAARRAVIADELRENPGRSNRWIGKVLGVNHETVAGVRRTLESTGGIRQLDRTQGADGKFRPASGATPRVGSQGEHEHLPELPDRSRPAHVGPHVLDLDDEAILRAAAEIRQRRVADQLREIQERRRANQPPPTRKLRGARVLCGDCNDLIPTLKDGAISLVVTSPPYAEQRSGHYAGIPEAAYPEFTVGWMGALRDKLAEDGSVLIVIRPHLRDGVLSDYVLRTRLALRESGWRECEELIWLKPNSPPLGSKLRPRRAWESILWFGTTAQPFCDLKACGKESGRMGFGGSPRFAESGTSGKTGWHPGVESFGYGNGTARVTDVFVAPVGSEEPGVDHPAVFPISLAEGLIRTFSQEGDTVLDPFCGSGQTLLAARDCGRDYLGIDLDERYVRMARERLGR
jgi:site-specific DNA-methyltransferase (adenine-specific)